MESGKTLKIANSAGTQNNPKRSTRSSARNVPRAVGHLPGIARSARNLLYTSKALSKYRKIDSHLTQVSDAGRWKLVPRFQNQGQPHKGYTERPQDLDGPVALRHLATFFGAA
jgi:hypothetical protein